MTSSESGRIEGDIRSDILIWPRELVNLMKYRVVIEHETESGHYVATVPGLPGIFAGAKAEDEALELAKEGIVFYLEELEKTGRRNAKQVTAKVVTVEV